MAIKTKLLKHQQEAVDVVKNLTFYALLMQPGLGKTLAALAIIDERKKRFPKYTTLYVCPNTLIENVMDEAQKHTTLSAVPLVGSRVKRQRLLEATGDVFVINYEGTRIMINDLLKRKFDCVIFDESHSCKGHTTLQSKACYHIAMQTPHRIIMTGTMIHNSPLDAFGQYRLLSNDIFGDSYYRFRAHYAVMGGFLGKQVQKYINMDTFLAKIKKCSMIKTKEECLDLPPKVYEVVHVDMSDDQKKMYKQLKESFLATMKDHVVTAPVMLTRIMRFSQITAGFYKDIEGKEHSYEKNPKTDWLVTWLKETQAKTVVFVRFIKELKDLEQRLAAEGIRAVSVYGDTKERISLVKRFNADPELQVFIGQIDTAGQGINLQAANYCVFLSNNYSYGDREQAESRIHRQGQKALSCTYIDVVARDTIDINVLKILKKKESLAGMLKTDLVRCV